MKYLSLLIVFVVRLLIVLAQVKSFGGNEWPTFTGVCELQGDWCTTQCQIAGGSGGRCNKVRLCVCSPL
ncbi:uncharacterized protein LOC133843194 [Drosophila sulfurigaster albostrigata]|uniref:uncharacterized protein LOC133843194 n=1 Tax=Drosophila sulfurigaster albostrigata TaxID=89887 RepID=UPI002D21B8D8|nr:uncharacterized protein LOC133843194 [Drosophila sulfurigaster albostrigata]